MASLSHPSLAGMANERCEFRVGEICFVSIYGLFACLLLVWRVGAVLLQSIVKIERCISRSHSVHHCLMNKEKIILLPRKKQLDGIKAEIHSYT